MEISCESVLPRLSPKQPWFVAQNLEDEGDDTQVDIFYNIHDPLSHYRCQIPELHGNRVRGCFHGCWVQETSEAVITLLPILEYVSPFLFIDCGSLSLFLKGSSTELFLVVLGSTDEGKTVGAVKLLKLEINNMTWEEIEDLKDTVLSVELIYGSPMFYSPAIASSEFGGYIHILADNPKIIYSYHVKDKTISFSSIPCVAGTNHVSAWAMLKCTRLESDHVLFYCKQEKEGHKEDEIVVRSVKCNHEVDSHLFNLPPHVLENLVMEFCAGVDYLKFRATCKRCHLAAPLIPWNNWKASKIMQNYALPSPWLIVFDKHKGIMTLTDPMFGDKYFIKTPQELICDFQIKCSRFGWLLILKPCGLLVFFNPFTNDILELPELPDIHKDTVCFSAPPTSPDCMVVGMILGPWQACIHIVGGEPSWRRTVLNIRGYEYFTSITFYGRDLYALRGDGGFDIFKEMGRENHKWWRDVAKAPASCCTSVPQCFQLRCDQHILRVIVGTFGESVEVFTLTLSRKWLKVVDLRKHMIFISGASSVCLDAKTPQMANKIYFPSSPIMYYSLETCRFHTLNNEDSFGDFFGTKHHLTSHAWIEPRWS
ncbi:hypothetical protein Tco_0934524 [Tanacetum coccineum]